MIPLTDIAGDWWTMQQAGRVGAGIGLLGGLFGTVLGSCRFLVQRGEAKELILGGWGLMAVIGAAALIAGCVGLAHQPDHVLRPLFLTGSLFVGLGTLLGLCAWKQYKVAEARKMDAAQIRGG